MFEENKELELGLKEALLLFESSFVQFTKKPTKDNMDEFFIFRLWLNENLPEFLSVWINLNKPISWNIEKPFNLTIARLNRVSGKLSKNFPPKANKIARHIDPKKINFLRFLDIFLEDVFVNDFNR